MPNEIQTLTLSPALPTAGTVNLHLAADVQSLGFAQFANAASLEIAIETFAAVGSGNTTIDLTSLVFTIEFDGARVNTAFAQLSDSANALTAAAGSVTITSLVTGMVGVQEVQEISFDVAPAGGDLHINGITVAGGAAMTVAQVETAIEDAGGANKPCSVTGTTGTGPFPVTYTTPEPISDTLLDFTGSTLYWNNDVGLTITTVQQGDAFQNEIQNLQTDADEGSFTLSGAIPILGAWGPSNTLNYNDSAATVEATIETAMQLVDPTATCTCTGTLAGGMTVEFDGTVALLDIDQMTYSVFSTLNEHVLVVASVSTTTQGVTPVKAKFRVTLPGVATGGTYKLTLDATTETGSIPYNGSQVDIENVFGAAWSPSALITSFTSSLLYEAEFNTAGPHTVTATTNTLTQSVAFAFATTQQGQSEPDPDSLDVTTGDVAGGTAVTITGTGFVTGCTVEFGGVLADNIVFVNATTITCDTPAHSAGAVDVVVENTDGGTGTLVNGFTYTTASGQPPRSMHQYRQRRV